MPTAHLDSVWCEVKVETIGNESIPIRTGGLSAMASETDYSSDSEVWKLVEESEVTSSQNPQPLPPPSSAPPVPTVKP
jgi:hypothetical protein